MSCPHCREAAKFVDYRPTSATTLAGSVQYARAYYHCDHCHTGWLPTDEEMGIEHKQTPGCREVVSLTGDLEPFAEAAERLLTKLTGLNLSASTVRRVTEAVGDEGENKVSATLEKNLDSEKAESGVFETKDFAHLVNRISCFRFRVLNPKELP